MNETFDRLIIYLGHISLEGKGNFKVHFSGNWFGADFNFSLRKFFEWDVIED